MKLKHILTELQPPHGIPDKHAHHFNDKDSVYIVYKVPGEIVGIYPSLDKAKDAHSDGKSRRLMLENYIAEYTMGMEYHSSKPKIHECEK